MALWPIVVHRCFTRAVPRLPWWLWLRLASLRPRGPSGSRGPRCRWSWAVPRLDARPRSLGTQKWKVTQRTPWDSKPTRSVKIVFLWQRSIFVFFFLMFSFGMYFGVFSKSAYSSCLYTTIEFNAGWSFQSILKLLANWGSSSRFQTCEGWKFKIL